MNVQAHSTLVVGITARMLAELAVQADYPVISVDYFGDADLKRLCPGISLRHDLDTAYSAAALVDAAERVAAPFVVYGASLENHPELVAQVARKRTLLGNSPRTLANVRDPHRLARALSEGGFRFPRTVMEGAIAEGERWLWKPLHSGGGHKVQFLNGGSPATGGIYQEWLDGMVGSAAFVADGQEAVLLGVTEQLVGDPVFGADNFRYCGNLLPPRLPAAACGRLVDEAQAIARHLTRAFDLRGLNGLDFIWHDEHVWTIEVNPRPTAAMELMAQAYNLPLFAAHVNSFAGDLPTFDLEWAMQRGPAAGKAIVFAAEDITVGGSEFWSGLNVRDLPHPGERIARGHPICTLLAWAPSAELCRYGLERQAAQLKGRLRQEAGSVPANIEVATYG